MARTSATLFAGLALVLAMNAGCAVSPGSEPAPAAAPSTAGTGQTHRADTANEREQDRHAAGRSSPSKAPVSRIGGSSPVLQEARPLAISIPRIALQSQIMSLGQQEDHTLEVPPGEAGSPAGWYVNSPTPGERGPSIILGHVNSLSGSPGVFARLQELVPGDKIIVDREDGTAAVFSVRTIERYEKDSFPALEVYGNTSHAEIRLITCDGYDPQTGLFEENLVAYARLAAATH
jgi:LPXTG-site transpeptidase (sortase) family protein